MRKKLIFLAILVLLVIAAAITVHLLPYEALLAARVDYERIILSDSVEGRNYFAVKFPDGKIGFYHFANKSRIYNDSIFDPASGKHTLPANRFRSKRTH